MSRALCKFGRKKRGVRDDINYTCTNLKIVRLGIARTHGWVELAPMVPTSSSHRSSTVLKYTVLTNSSCQVFLLSERVVSYKYGVLIRLTYMFTVWNNFSYLKWY